VIGHIWNIIGGSLVCGMLAGVFYLLLALVTTQMTGSDQYWDLKYVVRIFAGLLFFYLVAPVVFANAFTFIFGSNKALKRARR